MNRIKVVNDITDLVPVLRAVDTEVKMALFDRLSKDWITEAEVKKDYGEEGLAVLGFFDRMKLVESRWASPASGKEPVKSYHTYYSTVSINTTASLAEFSEILSIAAMEDKDYAQEERRIMDAVGEEGSRFISDVAEDLGMSSTRLKGLVKRSEKLDYRGHRVEVFKKGPTSTR